MQHEFQVPEYAEGDGQPPLLLIDRLTRRGADVRRLTLNRPDQRNALSWPTITAIRQTLEEYNSIQGPDIVIITGSGDDFSAGGDLKGYQTLYRRPDDFRSFMEDFDAVCNLLERGPFISISMVNGTCVAGGLELALACDFVTIAESARIGDGHLRFAQLPGGGGSQRLVRAIGIPRARQWLLTGHLYPASHAVETGLAIFAAASEDLHPRTLELVDELAGHSREARRQMKRLIVAALTEPLDAGLETERNVVFDYATTSQDAQEGLSAFVERRRPSYQA